MSKFIQNLLHAVIPSKDNDYRPSVLSSKALASYAVLTMLVMAFFYYTSGVQYERMLAQISEGVVINQTNAERQVQSILPLTSNEKLSRAAQMKAEDMIARDYFSHNGPDGERPWVWFDRAGYEYALAGENLAIDFFDPQALSNAWINSPSHAKNILNDYFTDIGIGVAEGEFEGRQTIVVVMFLGREITPTLQVVAASEAEPPLSTAPEPEPVVETQPEPVPEIQPEPISQPKEQLSEVENIFNPNGEAEITAPEEVVVVSKVSKIALEQENELIKQVNGADIGFVRKGIEENEFVSINLPSILLSNGLRVFMAGLLIISVFAGAAHPQGHKFAIPRVLVLALMFSVLSLV